jgi:hypothetical protein
MQNFFKKDIGIILLLILLFFAILPFFYLKQGLLLIDTGREFYIPQQMLEGNVLYKDIYNIYGALSYQINAILMAIFGQKMNVLYIAGCINSLFIIVTLYLLSREFLKKSFSFLFSVVMIFALVFPTFLYNSNLTYCFAIVYALSAFLLSVLFLIKYIKNDNTKMAYLSCLFAGISIASKYEFCFYIFVLLFVLAFIKPIGIKNFIKSVLLFLCIPILSYGFLLIQGLNLQNIKETVVLTQNLVNAPLVKLFFNKTGIFFNISYLSGLIKNNGIMAVFAIIPLLNLILFMVKAKEIYKDKAVFTLVLCAIAASAKSFLYLNINHMGLFIFPICALTLLVIVSKYTNKFIAIALTACILLFAAEDFSSLKDKNYLLETPKGNITTYAKEGILIKTAYDFILNNTNSENRVVIMPEGSFINYITDRKGTDFYYNLSPLFYNDVFGEQRVIDYFRNNLPDYFIILPIDNIEYGSSFFGKDYAQNFYEIITDNYDLTETKNNIEFFKRKNM